MPSKKDGTKRKPVAPRGQMTRKVGSFWPDEVEALEREAKEKRVSEAEVLRRALRAYLKL